MGMTERFTIDIIDNNNWLIQDTVTGRDYNPLDGTANVLKGMVSLLNSIDTQNRGIQKKVWDLLDFLEEEYDIDKKKVIDWWNGDVE